MSNLPRIYESIIDDHLQKYADKMILLAGPRQVGKTTFGKMCLSKERYNQIYLNWDDKSKQKIIIGGLPKILESLESHKLSAQDKLKVIYFDELHKYKKWKLLLRGYQSNLESDCRIVVTGSARMEVLKKGGESLKGLCFLYHVFPISVAELIRNNPNLLYTNEPLQLDKERWDALVKFGGFPDPYLKSDMAYYNRWSASIDQQLFGEDLKNSEVLGKSIDSKKIKKLADLLKCQVSSKVNYTSSANNLNVKEEQIKSWVSQLESLYYCFEIFPWNKQVPKTICRNPKIYLWDWSGLSDEGARYENLVAVHLKKAIDFWNNNGGKYELYYLDGKMGEVDFLVTKDEKPWLMVEVKSSEENIHPALHNYISYLTEVQYILQVIGNMPYQDLDCFNTQKQEIRRVPMITFLSQLV